MKFDINKKKAWRKPTVCDLNVSLQTYSGTQNRTRTAQEAIDDGFEKKAKNIAS